MSSSVNATTSTAAIACTTASQKVRDCHNVFIENCYVIILSISLWVKANKPWVLQCERSVSLLARSVVRLVYWEAPTISPCYRSIVVQAAFGVVEHRYVTDMKLEVVENCARRGQRGDELLSIQIAVTKNTTIYRRFFALDFNSGWGDMNCICGDNAGDCRNGKHQRE